MQVSDTRRDTTARADAALTVVFCLAALAVRLPILNLYLIDWDESTFLIMAQHVADGGLPYLGAWDNKPPLLFWLIAPISALANGDIAPVRLAAGALDIVTALLAKRLADQMFGASRTHWFVAIACYAVTTRAPAGGMLSSYSFAVPLMLGALTLLAAEKTTRLGALAAGALFGAAALCRLNFAIPAAELGVYVLARNLIPLNRDCVVRAVLYGAGGFGALALAAAPYALAGELDAFAHSVFLAPMAYVEDHSARPPLLHLAETLARQHYLVAFILFAIAGLALSIPRLRAARKTMMMAIFSSGVLLCISLGPIYSHYLTALIAPTAIWSALTFDRLLEAALRLRVRTLAAAALVLALSYFPLKTMLKANPGEWEPSTRVYALLTQQRQPGDSYYFAVDQINAWRLHVRAPSPIVTHPDNLFLPYFYAAAGAENATPAATMKAILARAPTWIVLPENDERYWTGTPVAAVLQPALAAHYDRLASFDERAVYRRKITPLQALLAAPADAGD